MISGCSVYIDHQWILREHHTRSLKGFVSSKDLTLILNFLELLLILKENEQATTIYEYNNVQRNKRFSDTSSELLKEKDVTEVSDYEL